jgi:hypothetical protein
MEDPQEDMGQAVTGVSYAREKSWGSHPIAQGLQSD